MSSAPRGGQLARLAGMWCNNSTFAAWLYCSFQEQWNATTEGAPARERAADVLRMVCGIDSRAQLDHDVDAAERFQRLIRGPYMRHTGTA